MIHNLTKLDGIFYQDREWAKKPDEADAILPEEWVALKGKMVKWITQGISSIAYELGPDDDDIELMVFQGSGRDDNYYMFLFVEVQAGEIIKSYSADTWATNGDTDQVLEDALRFIKGIKEDYEIPADLRKLNEFFKDSLLNQVKGVDVAAMTLKMFDELGIK